ncbi:MAG: CPBP family intramembrane metalloprotease [Myxococcales bacterium]|nr:CPBP family intramembrane metalloprotease [Myxococcales bacterium]
MSAVARLRDQAIQAALAIKPEPGHPFGPFEAGALLVAAVGLVVMQFVGAETVFLQWFGDALVSDADRALLTSRGLNPLMAADDNPWYHLLGLTHWVGFCVVGYVLIPALYLKLTGRSVRAYGYLAPGGFVRHAWVYLALASPVLITVWIVSGWSDFQAIYPFYVHASRSWGDLLLWELAYGVQFAALEFFFRGFLLETQRRWAGLGAVFIMLLPYCMVHFQKTAAESLGSLAAGLVLGVLAMRWRSVWGGVMVHWLIAIAMDVASLVRQSRLPEVWWP